MADMWEKIKRLELLEQHEHALDAATNQSVRDELYKAATRFTDITSISSEPNCVELVHGLTGRRLRITAEWLPDEEDKEDVLRDQG